MNNQQVAWIVAAIIIVGLMLAVVFSKVTVEAGPVEGVTGVSTFSPSDVMADRALDCVLHGGTWNAYAGHCEMYGTSP